MSKETAEQIEAAVVTPDAYGTLYSVPIAEGENDMPTGPLSRQMVGHRISGDTLLAVAALMQDTGLSQADVVELSVRDFARAIAEKTTDEKRAAILDHSGRFEMESRATTMRLTEQARYLLRALSQETSAPRARVGQTSVLEAAVWWLARHRGVQVPRPSEAEAEAVAA